MNTKFKKALLAIGLGIGLASTANVIAYPTCAILQNMCDDGGITWACEALVDCPRR
jgi:hypothetical protein